METKIDIPNKGGKPENDEFDFKHYMMILCIFVSFYFMYKYFQMLF